MKLEINGDLEKVIKEAVLSGEFDSPEAYIYEAIRQYRIQKVNQALAIGIQQLDRGEGIPLGELSFEKLLKDIEQKRNART